MERPAVLDSTMCARVNYEFFFFADASEKRRFEADPLRYCGIVTDPVSRVRFRPSTDSPRFDYERQRFYFSSDSTRARFAEMPEMFAAVQAKMKKEASQESVREKEEEPSQEP